MANTSITPFMLLVVPIPSVEIGPAWASEVITALYDIDSHDHSLGSGVQISPTGININADLTLNANNLTTINSLRLLAQVTTLAGVNDVGCVYRVGTNLYFNNSSGVPVQITNGNSLNNPGTGVITASTPGIFPYTVSSGDAQSVLLIDTSAARTINLPSAITNMFFMIKDKTGSARTNNISVVPNGTDAIENVNATFLLVDNLASYGFVSDGISKWYVV